LSEVKNITYGNTQMSLTDPVRSLAGWPANDRLAA